MSPSAPLPSLGQARLSILLAALLWSTSGAFTKVLRENTGLGLNEPIISPLAIAFWRVLFAGVVFLPLVRRRELSFRPALWLTSLAFAVMNALFVSAMALGSAANAILLQYTAPMWMYLISVWVLREPADRRGAVALVIGLAGIAVIVWGGWAGDRLPVVAIALGSGMAYAGVMIGLRLHARCVVALADGVHSPDRGRRACALRVANVRAERSAARGVVRVWRGADVAALLAGGAWPAPCQPAGGRHADATGTAAESAVGLSRFTRDGDAERLHAGRRRVHCRSAGVALIGLGGKRSHSR